MNKLITFLAFLFTVTSAYSQEMSISDFRLREYDITANTLGTTVIDPNGEICALIMIQTTETGFSFEAGIMGVMKTIYKPGEIWVYLPKGTKKISIGHTNLGTLKDYFFPIKIEGAKTYEMKLVSGKVITMVEDAPDGAFVDFTIEPAEATLYIDDVAFYSNSEGKLKKKLIMGDHAYRVESPYHKTENGLISVGIEPITRNISLEPYFGIISINSTPSDASVYINDIFAGKTPYTSDKIEVGEYNIRIEYPRYDIHEEVITVVSNPDPQQHDYALIADACFLDINMPDGSQLYIDNKFYKEWNGKIESGSHFIEAKKESHITSFLTVNLKPGDRKTITLAEPTPILGSLQINCDQMGSDVFIDDRQVGKIPLTIKEILAGKKTVKIIKPGYYTYSQVVDILDGKTAYVNATLKEEQLSKLTVTTDPEAVIFVNNQYMGKGYWEASLKSDLYEVKTVLKDKVQMESIHLKDGISKNVVLTYIASIVAKDYGTGLSFEVNPQINSTNRYSISSTQWTVRPLTPISVRCVNNSGKVIIKRNLILDIDQEYEITSDKDVSKKIKNYYKKIYTVKTSQKYFDNNGNRFFSLVSGGISYNTNNKVELEIGCLSFRYKRFTITPLRMGGFVLDFKYNEEKEKDVLAIYDDNYYYSLGEIGCAFPLTRYSALIPFVSANFNNSFEFDGIRCGLNWRLGGFLPTEFFAETKFGYDSMASAFDTSDMSYSFGYRLYLGWGSNNNK